jgi:hypothetical protein
VIKPLAKRAVRAVLVPSTVAIALGVSVGGCASRAPSAELGNRLGISSATASVRNLVSDVDLTQHLRTGDWTTENDEVVVLPSNWARLCLNEQSIPDYYSVRMEFTRLEGKEGFGLLLAQPGAIGNGFLFQLSAEGNRWAAINDVKNVRHIHVPLTLQSDRQRHALEVKVQRSGVEAFLDGEPVLRHPTDYSDIQFQSWGFGACSLGLISWYNKIVFHRVEVATSPRSQR